MSLRSRLLIGLLALFAINASASRIIEIEEFYHAKVKEILETRFPKSPFSVYVTVDTGRQEPSRRDLQAGNKKDSTRLPYWYDDEGAEEKDIWDRTDVPLGNLIKQVRSIVIDVRVDSSLSDVELTELQNSISKQLKLDPGADRLEISRMNWSDQERYRTFSWVGGFVLISFLIISGIFWLLAKVSISQLIKGLTKPIAEIGNSTKKFANSALNLASDMSSQGREKRPDADGPGGGSGSSDLPMDLNLLEIRKNALELLDRNRNLFETPDADFLEFLERKGAADPVTMGSILAELDQNALKTLFRYGAGEWWYKAIAQPAPLKAQSLAMLGEIDRLRVRRQFQDAEANAPVLHREFGLVMNRLKPGEIVNVLMGLSVEEAQPIIDLLPRDQGLSVAKSMFPGQWAIFIDQQPDRTKISEKSLEDILRKALKLKPLRNEDEIKAFFRDLDLSQYLDVATPRDERDFYMVLPELSRIRVQRFPFFKVLEGEDKILKSLGAMFSPHEWSIALANCEQGDRRAVLEKLTDRLRFQVIENLRGMDETPPTEFEIRKVRRDIVKVFLDEEHRLAMVAANEAQNATQPDSSSDDDEAKSEAA